MLRIIFLLALLTSCATSPDLIQSNYVSGYKYTNFTCNDLRKMALQKSDRIQELYKILMKKFDDDANNVAIGTLLWFPSLFEVEGDGAEAAEYAELKGEYNAIKQVLDTNNCQQEKSTTNTPILEDRNTKNPKVDRIGREIIQT